MEPLYIYLIKINIGFAVFYALYRILFNKDTFFEIRRFCLLTILVLCLCYPVIDLSSWLGEEPPEFVGYIMSLQYLPEVAIEAGVVKQTFWTVENILWGIYGCVVVILLVRLFFQLTTIFRFIVRGKRMNYMDTPIISLDNNVAPFSFFKWIFVNPDEHTLKEMQEIIVHERAHVKQLHSLDILISELICLFFWFNPAVWLLKHEISQNLEFLADEDVVRSGYNRKNYQYHLLRLSYQSAAAQLVNNFNVSQLKKRITMMNKKKTSRLGLVKYALLLPATVVLILSANIEAIARVARQVSVISATSEVVMKGKVVDDKGAPIAGATIVFKNSSKGVVTDTDGNFSISGVAGEPLIFSYVGVGSYETTLRKIEGIRITLGSEKTSGEVFDVVEVMPQFKGNILEYIKANLKYPEAAQKAGVQGRVYVEFIVDENGKVTAPRIKRGVSPELDTEAVRVVKNMPDWVPAKYRGKNVKVRYVLPLSFSMGKDNTVSSAGSESESLGKALYVVDGKTMPSEFDIKTVDRNTIESIDVLKDARAEALYGEQGKSGVIVVTTNSSHPLYVVDGKTMPSEFDIKTVSPNAIESITVLKGDSAEALYGEAGKNGVCVITMKK